MTALLRAWADGDDSSRDAVIEATYIELRRIARNRIRGEINPSIDATGLAHEVYARLIGQERIDWQSRAQFFKLAARLMRRILVDRHRSKKAAKRWSGHTRVALSGIRIDDEPPVDLDALCRALDRLESQDERQARIVELRFFAGLTIEDTAEVIGVSARTVKRDWAIARAWLKRELGDDS